MASPFIILGANRHVPAVTSLPQEPPWFWIVPGEPPIVYLPQGSQVFAVDTATAAALADGVPDIVNLFRTFAGSPGEATPPGEALPAWNALSLNVAQLCNLTCDYCYADEGRFGGHARLMEPQVAAAAVKRFIDAGASRSLTVGFIGGEPFLNRQAIFAAVDCALEHGTARGLDIRFSITTNGTLITAEDIAFLRRRRFAVSISVDGSAEANDAHRRARNGAGSFEQVRKALTPLLADPQGCRIAARATVTRDDLRIVERLDALEAMGFTEAGISPLRSGPSPRLALRDEDWPILLAEMRRAGERERERVMAGLPMRFSNLYTALRQIHRGHSLPLPCGAGANYLSASAEGELFTCHRTIDDRRFRLGDLSHGPSDALRSAFLSARHVDHQEPCRSCWARYLCGGGCHAEVIASGRHGCDFIRGWLEYCLRFHHWALCNAPGLLSEPTQ